MSAANPVIPIAAAFCALLASAPAQADSVRTRAEGGYGRILFVLDKPAHPDVAVTGGVLTISFDRKVDVPSSSIAQNLGAYVSSVRRDADGKTFRIALSQSIHLHTSSSANDYAVDLLPETFAGAPSNLPPPPAKQRAAVDVASLPALPIRVGAYSNFSRVVFDWPRKVPYAVFPGAGVLTVRFEAEARPDFAALKNVAPPWVKETGWRIESSGTIIEFATDAASGYHDFRDGTKIVVDILAPKADAATYKPPGDSSGDIKVTRLTPASVILQQKAVAAAANALAGKPAAAAPAATPVKSASGADNSARTAAATTAPTLPIPPSAPAAERKRDGFVLDFPDAGNRAAAAFVRGATAWIVLDGAGPIDLRLLKQALGDLPLEATSGDGASVLRIGLKQPMNMTVHADGSHLKIVLASGIASDATAIGFVRSDDIKTAALTTLLPGATHAIRIADPVVGDLLTVVPALPGRASPQARQFVEFSLPPTAAGLVVSPLADDLTVTVLANRVTIGRPQGLTLDTPSQAVVESPAFLAKESDSASFLDFARWARAPGGAFLEQVRRLREAVAAANPEQVNQARLRLAQFYLANEYAPETLGLVSIMEASDAALQGNAQLQTMRAAADYMMGRYRDAHNDIAGSAFDNDRHGVLWRGLIEAGQRNWDAARKDFAQASPVIQRYTPEWRARAYVAWAKAALAADAIETADQELSRGPDQLPKAIALQVELARGQLDAEEGRYSEAIGIFHAIDESGDERAGAEAVLDGVEAGLAAGAISQDAAIDHLEQLRFRWRGDALELETLRKLGALYFARQRWHEGFATLRIASLNFPNDDLARQAQDDMRNEFVSLFLKGKADRMPPIQALGLFFDFIDLTPIGPDGDEMIRHMADRLVAVDLLEPAASLLSYQVNKRLDGIARAQVSTRLAMIDLLDHKPKEALEALRTSQIAGLPPDDTHARMILQARALAALKQWDQALDLIATDDQADSQRLRADIYWESGNWEVAGQKAEELAGGAASEATPLANDTRSSVMRAAIAYSLAGDEAGLERLRKGFGAKMQASPDAVAFSVITEKLDTQGSAFRDTAGQIASIDTLEAFMQDFRKRYEAGRVTN